MVTTHPVVWALLLFSAIGTGVGIAIMIASKRQFGVWIP